MMSNYLDYEHMWESINVCTYVNEIVLTRAFLCVCYLDRAVDCSPDILLKIPGRRWEHFCLLHWCRCVCECGSLWHTPEYKLTTSPTKTSQSFQLDSGTSFFQHGKYANSQCLIAECLYL